eukprot:TRINITY_DN12508_c0_g1_i1.p1 TRINITY_DN12508_c0_g1~~TRINITY_DN12508_c0_g1_i1.p1  ORF type:complete len:156 (-),score=12.68 TRINITY_DN12508_c0_g1_i1:150-617(-)
MALDGLDGFLARCLAQESEFGASLDVLVDNFSRGVMWVVACGVPGCLVMFLEMTVFACTHAEGGKAWKVGCFSNAPPHIASIMRNGFRSPLGVLAIAGLHFLPLWLWLHKMLPSSHLLTSTWLGALLLIGRCTAGVVELWVVCRHFNSILIRDAA